MLITAARDKLVSDQRPLENRIEELLAYQARTHGLDEQLAEKATALDELQRTLDDEEARRTAAEAKIAELSATLEDARIRRIEERAAMDERHSDELERLDDEKQAALGELVAGHEAVVARLREAHEAELGEVRAGHERSVALLRGELEPKVLEARSLGEERERLANELAMVKMQSERDAAARAEAHQRELAQAGEKHASDLAAQARSHASELSRALGERDVEILEHQQTKRRAELREKEWEQATAQLRTQETKLNAEIAASHERCAILTVEKAALDDRLATAALANEQLAKEVRALRDRVDQLEREARRSTSEREQLVHVLQDGLAILGVTAGPEPDDLTESATVEMEAD
jgi:hypothetical protein